MGIGLPDERDAERHAIGHSVNHNSLMMTISLAQLSLHTIAINSMMETTLGDADEDG